MTAAKSDYAKFLLKEAKEFGRRGLKTTTDVLAFIRALEAGALRRTDREARLNAAEARAEKAEAELSNIANAKRFDKTRFGGDTEFAYWAQNRARAALWGKS